MAAMTEAQLHQWFDAHWPNRNWSGLCQAVMVNAAQATDGLSKVYPTATAARAASGWLNPDSSTAPVGAQHWWDIPDPDGHVALELGGGRVLHGAPSSLIQQAWGANLGVATLTHITKQRPGWVYLGWTRNNGTNTITLNTTGTAGGGTSPFEEDDMQLTDPITPDTGRGDVNAYLYYTRRDVLEANKKLEALTAAVGALAVAQGLDPQAISELIAERVEKALADDFARLPTAEQNGAAARAAIVK